VNNLIIPSTHAERNITVCSHKHSITPYPSLSPYSQTDSMTDRGMNTIAARGLEELFSSCAVVSDILILAGNRFWWYLLRYIEYNTVVVLCQFFGSGRKYFLVLHTYLVYNTFVRLVVSVFWLWWEIVLWQEIVFKMRTPFDFL
jgi:hypothetical protein